MANDGQQGKSLATTGGDANLPATGQAIKFGEVGGVDLSALPPDQVQALVKKHTEAMIDVNQKAQMLKVEVGALGAGLGTMADTVKAASAAGTSATITHSQSNTLGRTEVILGNTETAAKGKLSARQGGAKDYTLYYVALAAVVVIVLAIVLTRHQ